MMIGKMMDTVGRKVGLIISQIVSLIGWIIIASSIIVVSICIGRFVCGMASAATALIGKNLKYRSCTKLDSVGRENSLTL